MPSNFQKAMRLINYSNRTSSTSAILSGIRRLSVLFQDSLASWGTLQGLGESLKVAIRTGTDASSIIGNIKKVALEMIPEVERTAKGPDLFTEMEEKERREIDTALPPDFVRGWLPDSGGMWAVPDENELVTAARKPASPVEVLVGIAGACDAAAAFRPEPSANRKDFIRKYYESGKEGLGWYDNVNALLTKYFGKQNAQIFAKLLAATSPRMPVERNLTTAIEAFNRYVNEFKNRNRVSSDKDISLGDDPNFRGRMANYFMRTHVPNIGHAMSGSKLSGSKVDNFSRALSGDPDAVTLDVWMGRAMGIKGNLFNNPESYQVVADAIRELATEAGVEPRQYQAAVWTGIKKEQGRKGQTASSFDALMGKFWDNFAVQCFKPNVKAPKVPSKYPLFETASRSGTTRLSAWILGNCRFARSSRTTS